MPFKINNEKEDGTYKSIKVSNNTLTKINKITKEKHITFTKFVNLALKYAIDNMEDE